MTISPLDPQNRADVETTARLLQSGFRDLSDSWNDLEKAIQTVEKSFGDDRLSLIARKSNQEIVGWIGGISNGRTLWELHPLVVREDHRRESIGKSLVKELESQVAKRGGLTIWLGTDDEMGLTSLSGVDLYPNPIEHLQMIRNTGGHPFGFYLHVGYHLVGVIPDASGYGKPDILMAKRLSQVL